MGACFAKVPEPHAPVPTSKVMPHALAPTSKATKWDAVASSYAHATTECFRRAAETCLLHVSTVTSNSPVVLDLASGPGPMVFETYRKFPNARITATDISQGMLKQLIKLSSSDEGFFVNNPQVPKDAVQQQLRTEVHSMTDLMGSSFATCTAETYDLVTCQFGAEFLTAEERKCDKFWEGIAKVMKKDATCLVSSWNEKKFVGLFFNAAKQSSEAAAALMPTKMPELKTPESLEAEMRDSGVFKCVKVQVVPITFSAPSVDELWERILAFSPMVQSVAGKMSQDEVAVAKGKFTEACKPFLRGDESGAVDIPCTFNLGIGST